MMEETQELIIPPEKREQIIKVYIIHTMKINQLDLKHLCYDLIYVIIQMRIF